MGDILGVGLSHYPPVSGLDEEMCRIFRWTLEDPDIPAEAKDPANWPDAMRREWGDDEGRSAALDHRAGLLKGFERVREAIDDFEPDAIVIWGDDQYENFKEDIIPPFAVLAYEDTVVQPWRSAQESSDMVGKPNYWDEGPETSFTVRGRRDIAKHLTISLLNQGIDIPYAYEKLHHEGIPHAFLNAVLYLDYHRKGFDYPIIPFSVNCYGSRVVSYRGYVSRFADIREPDPPAPPPWRMLELGRATVRAMVESPWRICLMSSSSWSHAFNCDKTWRLRPVTEADRRMHEAMKSGDIETWRNTQTAEIEENGHQELLNWFPLVGAMDELGRTPTWTDFVETHIFNSNKVFATYEA